jgi:hypothetical protein
MFVWGVLTFCRIVTGFIFALSSVQKARDVRAFAHAITRFDLLPARLSMLFAFLTLACEGAIVLCMLLTGSWLLMGFVLATALYLIFSGAMISVLLRNMTISCNCFGVNNKPITLADLWRNVGFLCCAFVGWITVVQPTIDQRGYGLFPWVAVAMLALIFSLLWLQSGEIVRFLSQK